MIPNSSELTLFNSIYLVNDDVIFPGILAHIFWETGKNLEQIPGKGNS